MNGAACPSGTGALQVAQDAAAPHAAVASSPAGASSKRAEPNAELLLEKLREHILEKGASLLARPCSLPGTSALRAIQRVAGGCWCSLPVLPLLVLPVVAASIRCLQLVRGRAP